MDKDKDNIGNLLERAHRSAEEEAGHVAGSAVPLDEERSEEAKDAIQAIEAMRKYADEDDDDMGEFSFKSILGGDFLRSKFVIKQIVFMMFCVVLMIGYTANRYDSQQDVILIDSLRTELQNVKYNVLTQSSELMNLIRQSNIEKRLRETSDSLLRNSITPPYLIRVSEEDGKPAEADVREVLIDSAVVEDAETSGGDEVEDEKKKEDSAGTESRLPERTTMKFDEQ